MVLTTVLGAPEKYKYTPPTIKLKPFFWTKLAPTAVAKAPAWSMIAARAEVFILVYLVYILFYFILFSLYFILFNFNFNFNFNFFNL
jgi:hypothetical protein